MITDFIMLVSLALPTQNPPPENPPSATVGPRQGALVIVGGGQVSPDIVKQFVTLAGGKDSEVVVIPTAAENDPVDLKRVGEGFTRSFGFKNVTVLHTRDRAEADSEGFVAPLKKARAVWFNGGRQWRIVDSFLGTRTQREIEAVLERGGVIGGSSAGATIQGSYLVRGARDGNDVLMAKGYEQGFGYLKGVAVDQHILPRGRADDLVQVIGAHPDLLGLGIDESTAVVVEGDRFEVIGRGVVGIYDGKNHDGKRYYFLAPGEHFDLRRRRRVSSEANRPSRLGTLPTSPGQPTPPRAQPLGDQSSSSRNGSASQWAGAQATPSTAVRSVTTPKQFFGFHIGDDYSLANYQQLKGYWEKLERESDRIKVVNIGPTAEGRPQIVAIVTSAANHRRLDRYKQIARRLALADGLDQTEAHKLAVEGKAVVWIDAGIHATETLCPQAMIETVFQLLAGTDDETLRLLDDVIILFVHANPDGHDLVADWYMREKDPAKRSLAGLPRLYQKYIGHDNNRDFYANTQAETKNLNRLMYREWFPQVMYNHHQTGPAGTVLFCSPFRDPFNYFCDPLVVNGIDAVGAAMVERFLAEGKPGATVRSGGPYSTWFNGGIRTTTSFHNIIGVMSETIGSPTPTRIPLVAAKQLPKGDYLAPIPPQPWHFRQSVDYSVTANKAVLDYASRHREQLLYNIWLMGHNAIERGNRDSWTITPKVVASAQGGRTAASAQGAGRAGPDRRGPDQVRSGSATDFERLFHEPSRRDPRGYILPADQTDFLTATKFINTLLATGVRVHRAAADFTVANRSYPQGSYVVKTAQAFRAHVLDMFEPQDHPHDLAYPGGPPVRPYDSAGYTPAFQMAVKFDRVLDGFDGPFEEIKELAVAPPPARVFESEGAAGFFLGTETNDSFRAVNRLQKAGEEVRRLQRPLVVGGVAHPAGTFFVPSTSTTLPVLEKIAAEIGTPFRGSTVAPGPEAVALKTPRIGLWDRQGGSIPSGWTRWLLEQFEFPFHVVFVPELDKGGLRDKFDVLILVDGAYAVRGGPNGGGAGSGDRPDDGGAAGASERSGNNPARDQRGSITTTATLPQLKKFLEDGGTLLAIGSSARLGRELGLPVTNHVATLDKDGREQPFPPEKFYVPSSVLRIKVDPSNSLAWGLRDEVDVMFSASPTFRLTDQTKTDLVRRVGWFDNKCPLRSGWAWGQEYLEGGIAIVDGTIGKGRLALFGPQVLFRGQPHGTFKFVFNGIVQSAVRF